MHTSCRFPFHTRISAVWFVGERAQVAWQGSLPSVALRPVPMSHEPDFKILTTHWHWLDVIYLLEHF